MIPTQCVESSHVFLSKSECLSTLYSGVFFLFIAAIALTWAAFGRGTGPVYLNNVRCTGTESSLLSCSHREIGVTYCSHSRDAGVVCPSRTLVKLVI